MVQGSGSRVKSQSQIDPQEAPDRTEPLSSVSLSSVLLKGFVLSGETWESRSAPKHFHCRGSRTLGGIHSNMLQQDIRDGLSFYITPNPKPCRSLSNPIHGYT